MEEPPSSEPGRAATFRHVHHHIVETMINPILNFQVIINPILKLQVAERGHILLLNWNEQTMPVVRMIDR